MNYYAHTLIVLPRKVYKSARTIIPVSPKLFSIQFKNPIVIVLSFKDVKHTQFLH